MRQLDGIWYTQGMSCIGIVRVDDQVGGPRYYIGVASGEDEQADMEFIAAHGAKFSWSAGKLLFGDK
jgi:hypothetical protein